MSAIIQRLQADLDQIRLLQVLVDDDDQTIVVAGVVETLVANLAKAKQCHTPNAADVIAAFVEGTRFAEAMGFFYKAPVAPQCPEADAVRASQDQLRAMLARSVANLDVKDARRIALLLVRSEKNLWRLLSDAKVLIYQSGLAALRQDLDQQLRAFKATMTTDQQREEWAEFVGRHLDNEETSGRRST